MMHGLRNLLWLAPLLLVLGWPVYGGGLTAFLAPPEIRDGEELRARRPEPEQQHFTMESVRFWQEVDGELQWRIDSRYLRTGESEDELLLAGVAATLFRQGAERLWISAEQGRYDRRTEVLELEDDVHLRDGDGFLLDTQALSYHEREGRVSSRAGVEIVAGDLRARGRSLDYYLADGQYDLTGEVEFLVP